MVFKNIRIPKRGGGTRLQRVKVLASGKYKFVKNLTKSRSAKKPTKTKTKRSVRKTAKKKRKGGKSLTQTAFKWLRMAALVAPAADNAMRHGIQRLPADIVYDYTGFNMQDGSFDAKRLMRGWGPYAAACLTTYGIPKLVNMIRRL